MIVKPRRLIGVILSAMTAIALTATVPMPETTLGKILTALAFLAGSSFFWWLIDKGWEARQKVHGKRKQP